MVPIPTCPVERCLVPIQQLDMLMFDCGLWKDENDLGCWRRDELLH